MGEIKDSFGRKHNYLRISLTDRCNLRCFYCMPEEGIEFMEKSHIMTIEEIIGIAKAYVELGVDTIRLTGGEPLIRKGFAHLISELSKLGVTLKITTNGILLDRYFDLFEAVGLKSINISLDTLDQARLVFITKRDYYDRIMANIQEAIRRGFEVKLNVVLIKGLNDREIPDFIRLTKSQHIGIKFIEFMPFRGNKWHWDKGVSEEEILFMANEHFTVQKLVDPAHSTSSNYRVQDFEGTFGMISTITKPFCSECNRLRLTADGKMKNCLFATKEADILGHYRAGEDIKPLILSSILNKKFSRDGMVKMDSGHYEQNRSMISIGG